MKIRKIGRGCIISQKEERKWPNSKKGKAKRSRCTRDFIIWEVGAKVGLSEGEEFNVQVVRLPRAARY